MFYQFELMMAGIILLSAMTAGGITLWLKRRKTEQEETKLSEDKESQTS
jgi:hypothetical protein